MNSEYTTTRKICDLCCVYLHKGFYHVAVGAGTDNNRNT